MDWRCELKRQLLSKTKTLLQALCVLLTLAVPVFAQTAVSPSGITPGSTQIKAGPVNVDMTTGNVVMIIPVRRKIGAFPFTFDLIGNVGNQGAVNQFSAIGGLMSSGEVTGISHPNPTNCGTNQNPTWKFGDSLPNEWSVSDGTGSRHPYATFPPIELGPSACGGLIGPVTEVEADNSGITSVVTGSTNASGQLTQVVYNKSGIAYTFGQWTDPDGNIISRSSSNGLLTWTDTLGQSAMNLAPGGNGAPDKYYYSDLAGTDQYYTVNYSSYTVTTVFGCVSPYGDIPPNTQMYFPSSLSTPAGTYSLSYESTGSQYQGAVTGRLQKVTLPTGGYVSFVYSGGIAGFNCTSRVIPTIQVTISDNNGNTNTTTYANSNTTNYADPCCAVFTVTVTGNADPDNANKQNVTVNSFAGEWLTQSAAYQGAATGTPLSLVHTDYTGTLATNLIKQTTTYTVYNSSSLTGANKVVTTYDCNTISPCYGNVTSVAKYDFGQTLISTTNITYGGCGTTGYIYDRPCSVTTLDSGNNQSSQTLYTYNATGHRTQTKQWVSGTNYLTSSATYNTNGTIATSTDVNGAQTKYNYDGSCNSQVPTSVTLPTINGVTLTTSETWNCNGGVVATSTDENGNKTTYLYADPLWRQTEVDYPDGGETKTIYNDTASPPNVQVNRLMDGSAHWLTTQTNFDGIGRPVQKLLTSDPNGTVHTITTYDVLGRVASVTNPYYTTGDATYGATQYVYDALGRTTSVTDPDGSQRLMSYSGAWSELQDEGNGTNRVSRISQHDGLGRLVAVCEISSTTQQGGGSPTSCGAFGANGYLTTYSYSALNNLTGVTQGSQTRSYGYDGLSRLTSESNPEASAATAYTYDAANQQSDLYQRVAPAPNQTGSATVTTTYQHDALHRLVSKAYSDGTTPNAFYYYDQSAPWGTTLTNYLGTLTTEGTYNGTSWITQAEYSYDKMGRAGLNAQAFGTQYNLNYTYDYLGDWATATNGVGTTFTYGYNQAAELSSLTSSLNDANHPPTLFSTSSTPGYNALGSLTADTLGNGSETLAYDNRGRLSTVATIGPDPGNNTPGKGYVAISGTEQAATTTAIGSITIGGIEGSKLVGCPKCFYVYDTGTVTVTIGGEVDQATYLQGSTPTSIATALAAAINADSQDLVIASQSGATVNLTSELSGSGGNYSLSVSVVSTDGFSPPSFTATPSGAALSGGSTTYDTGTVTVTVGGIVETVNYGQNDTPTSIASNLASKFNSDPTSLATGSASGGTLNLTSKVSGSGSNYSLSISTTWNSSKFSNASFAGTPSGPNLTGGANGSGNIYNLSLGYAPNSNIASANDTVNGNWTYGYDDFNRLTSANGAQNYTFAFDRYGNRWQENPGPQYSFTGNNNRIDASSGITYDSPGNVTNDGLGRTYFYDAENRLVQVGGTQGQCSTATACYIYDAEGRRACKTLSGSTVYYLYDLGGKEVAEVSSAGVWNRGEVYAGSRHLATYSGGSGGVTYFTTADWLGTERMRTGMSGPIVESCTSLPFGDAQTCTGSEVSPMHFTGKRRDTESGDDYFGARYYSSTAGRFMSPDPLLSSGRPENPQTWNRYTYGLNNPLSIIDPTGLYNLVNNCAGDDSKCNKAFAQDAKNLKDGLAALTTAVNGLKDGDQKTALQGALKAFGTENDGNNVGVQFGALSGNTAGNTALSVDSSGKFNFTVTFDPSKNQGMFNQAINAAHEGQHVEDISDPRYASDSTTLSPFQLEYRGYQTSSYAGQALGVNSLSYGKDVLWNSSWRAVDTQTLRDKGITQHVTSIPGHPEPQAPTPHDPWK